MLERLLGKIDIMPGGKTYLLAGVAAGLFWLNLVGVLPTDIYNEILPWILGLMAPTVALKAVRA